MKVEGISAAIPRVDKAQIPTLEATVQNAKTAITDKVESITAEKRGPDCWVN